MQECQCSVLFAGTSGPAACDVLPLPVWVFPVWVLPVRVLPAAGAEDVADAEQALIPSRAVTATVSAATAPRGERAPRRDIDMPSIMPGASQCLARLRPEPLAGGNGQEAAARWRSSRALRYSATTISVSSSTEVSRLYLSKVILPPCSRFTRSTTGNTWP